MNKKIIIITSIVILVIVLITVVYLVSFSSDRNPSQDGGYPHSVQTIINNPAERISEEFSNLVKNDNYVISYGGNQTAGTFFITINAEPVEQVSILAEQDFLTKLQIEEEYACSLTVVLNVPFSIDSNLSDYNFGLSFCSDRIHITDVARQPTQNTRYYDNFEESNDSQTDLLR